MKSVTAKDVSDAAAGAVGFATWLQYLPEVAAFLTILWLAIRIYEWIRVRFFGKEPIELKI